MKDCYIMTFEMNNAMIFFYLLLFVDFLRMRKKVIFFYIKNIFNFSGKYDNFLFN